MRGRKVSRESGYRGEGGRGKGEEMERDFLVLTVGLIRDWVAGMFRARMGKI